MNSTAGGSSAAFGRRAEKRETGAPQGSRFPNSLRVLLAGACRTRLAGEEKHAAEGECQAGEAELDRRAGARASKTAANAIRRT
jgi:hypothetical protein